MTTAVRYESPDSVKEAVRLLAGADNGRLLAGGTDLLVQMRSERLAPNVIVDVKRIEEMMSIRERDDGYEVGAGVSCMALLANEGFVRMFPAVAEAANLIGSVQVRGRATMAGNLCNASPAADSVPALIVADAQATIEGTGARRTVPVQSIPVGPGKTSLAADELLVSFFFPKPAPRTGMAYLRFTPRTEMDIAVVGAGVSLTLDAQGVCTAAQVCLGAVASTAVMVPQAAQALIGTRVDDAALQEMALAASQAARPIDDKRGTKAFRIKLAGVMARRSALKALERAQEQLVND